MLRHLLASAKARTSGQKRNRAGWPGFGSVVRCGYIARRAGLGVFRRCCRLSPRQQKCSGGARIQTFSSGASCLPAARF